MKKKELIKKIEELEKRIESQSKQITLLDDAIQLAERNIAG